MDAIRERVNSFTSGPSQRRLSTSFRWRAIPLFQTERSELYREGIDRLLWRAAGLTMLLTAIAEDPATGSACVNLGGWFLARAAALPLTRVIRQGDEVGRPSRLVLRVDGERRIFVSGQVVELGRGVIAL